MGHSNSAKRARWAWTKKIPKQKQSPTHKKNYDHRELKRVVTYFVSILLNK